MRAILIDPIIKEIKEIQLEVDENNEPTLESFYKHMECDLIERIVAGNKTLQIVLDEEGTFKSGNKLFMFYPTKSVYPEPFVGKAIVTGYDFTELPKNISLEFIKSQTVFIEEGEIE